MEHTYLQGKVNQWAALPTRNAWESGNDACAPGKDDLWEKFILAAGVFRLKIEMRQERAIRLIMR
jgi:hypothetical protein